MTWNTTEGDLRRTFPQVLDLYGMKPVEPGTVFYDEFEALFPLWHNSTTTTASEQSQQ